jgi:UrcA family protein
MRSQRSLATLQVTQDALGVAPGQPSLKSEETTMNTYERNKWTAAVTNGMSAVTLLVAFMGNAFASTPAEERPIRVVQFADLDLSRPAGISALYGRIETAANNVCESASNREMARYVRWHLCLNHAIARAVADLGIPALTKYHVAKTGMKSEIATLARQP